MDIFRFVTDDHLSVRLNLNDGVIWALGRGLDLGTVPARKVYLTQDGVDGAVLAESDRGLTQANIPLLLYHGGGATPANIRTAFNNLVTELDRPYNNIEFREPGDSVSYFMRTYRADIPSLRRGLVPPPPFKLGTGGPMFFVTVDREPIMTGAGAYI